MPEPDHWFEPVADHLGAAYLRYSFTRGTEQEVDFLVTTLGLAAGDRLLDVGCGPGRHAHAFARRGIEVMGVDISQRFVDIATAEAPAGATFLRADARALAFDAEFDAAISLCQGAFGLAGGPGAPLDGDGDVLDGIARALRPGGRAAVSAFSAYFQVRWLEDSDSFDAEAGVNHERTEVKDEAGVDAPADLWTTCFTPRELRLLARRAGLEPRHVWSVTPGAYAEAAPTVDSHEFLLVAARPGPSDRPGPSAPPA
jgi:SAM-dependent methyltransferase